MNSALSGDKLMLPGVALSLLMINVRLGSSFRHCETVVVFVRPVVHETAGMLRRSSTRPGKPVGIHRVGIPRAFILPIHCAHQCSNHLGSKLADVFSGMVCAGRRRRRCLQSVEPCVCVCARLKFQDCSEIGVPDAFT